MEGKMYTEEELQQAVREATHPHPLSMDTPAGQLAARTAVPATRPRQATTPVVRRHLAIPGLEDLTMEEDLLLGRWRLVQYSSTIDGKPGQWNNNLTEEIRNYLELVVLKITPSRAYFSEDRKLLCMSRNGTHSMTGKPCWGCRFAQWGDEGEPSPCSRGYTMICWDPKAECLCLIGALRTGVPPVKLYFSKLHHRGIAPFQFLTRFTAREEKGDKGKYMVIQPEIVAELTKEDQERYYSLYQALATVRIVEVEEPSWEEVEPAGPGHSVPPPPEEAFWQEDLI